MVRRRGLLLTGGVVVVVVAVLVVLSALTVVHRHRADDHPARVAAPRPAVVPVQARNLPMRALPPVDRPNILVIESDDMRTDDLRFMPSVRRLIGGRGLSFTNSFAPYPLCCPSRSSFLSGEYAHNHGVLRVTSPFGFHAFRDRTTIATVLQKAGYLTGLTGKYLNGYGEMPIHGTNRSSLHYVPPGWTDWFGALDHHFPVGSPMAGGTYRYFSMTQDHNGVTTPHRGDYSTYLVGRQTRSMISRFGARHRPWFIWSTPIAPHYGAPREKDDPGEVRNADGSPERFLTPARPGWVKGMFDQEITHPLGEPAHGPVEADMSDKPSLLRSFPETDPAEKKVMTELSRQRAESLYVLDRQVAKTLVTLHRTGQWAHTIVVFTSDNGYFLGEHRKRQGKILLHEPSLRVPFLIAGPGVPHGLRYDPISTVDLAPTFAAYAGVRGGMPRTDGYSMRPTIRHGDTGWTVPVVTESTVDNKGYLGNHELPQFRSELNSRGIRTARWKLTEYSTGEKELYDLVTDPLELDGLQDDPADRVMLARMERLWRSYDNCKQSACRRPLPRDLRATPAQERVITDREYRREAAYYDHPFVER